MKRNNEQTSSVVIDGQNIAFWPCSRNSPKDWNLVISAARYYYDKGISVVVFLPTHFFHKFDDDYKKTLRKYCVIQTVDCGNDKEMDDKLVVGYARIEDCYYLSNDKRMCNHFKQNNLQTRAWCEKRRIEFEFDEQGSFNPKSDPFKKNELIVDDSEVTV